MTHSGDGLHDQRGQTDTCEQVVRTAWRETLGSSPSNDLTNFFQAGGDSLLASLLVLRISKGLGVNLSLREVFDSPTPTGLARLCRSKAELPTETRPAPEAGAISKAGLSFSQERMWFMDALAAGTAAYHVAFALRFRGRLSETALQSAFAKVIERHTVLKTAFPTGLKGPEPRVTASTRVVLEKHKLPSSKARSLRETLDSEMTRLARRPLDLAAGPLLRPTLIRIGKDDVVLLVCMHHIVADQWSFDILISELAHYYRAEIDEPLQHLPSPEISYEHYAAWHRNWFMSDRIESDLKYWRQQLEGLERASLTADFDRPPEHGFQGARLRVPLDQSRIDRLTRTGTDCNASLAMVLLTSLFIAIHEHTGASDIGIGVPVANRHHHGSENLIGTLVNTLVVRTDLGGNPGLIDVLEQVRENLLEALEHQDTPFELLIRELQQSRDPSRSPYFSVLFNMLNTPARDSEFGSVVCERMDVNRAAAQFDLTLTIDAVHDRSICFEYSTALFHRSAIERFSQHVIRILDALAAGKNSSIRTIPILSHHDLALLEQWSKGPTNPVDRTSVPALFAAQARRTPDKPAIRFGKELLTYRELLQSVNRLANSLRQRGIGKGDRVGVCLWRSPLMVIAPLAVLRCGASYLPLDSRYPAERIRYFIEDAAVSVVLTQASLLAALELLPGTVHLVDIESRTGDTLSPTAHNDGDADFSFPEPSDTAYIIYTSGSTGQPKGVEVLHGSVTNFLLSMLREPGLDDRARLLAVTPLTFDIAVLELFLPLCCGAEIVLASREQIIDGKALADLIETSSVTAMQATPSTWQFLVDAGWKGQKGLRILVGGEPLRPELARALLARAEEVWNMYGPTESTVWSSCWRVDSAERNRISLGRPIANTEILILDTHLRQVPIGAEGELCIAGAGLAAGYLNRPDLTARTFVANGRSPDDASKIYRTGDKARWRHDGSLAFRGRSDDQVKIRGHRVELGEIESRLAEHDGVAAAVVTTNEAGRGETSIVAFVVPRNDMPSSTDFRIYLKKWLPDYMLPRIYIELDALPMLSSGKLNRAQLANASMIARESNRSAKPRNEFERTIHDIWCDILGLSEIALDDNFFDIGGHSLLAARIVGQVSSQLGTTCAMPMLFRFPTIASLSAALQSTDDTHSQSLLTLQPHGNGLPVYCISGSDIYQVFAQQLAPDYPVHAAFSTTEAAYWSTANCEPGSLPGVDELASEYLEIIQAHHSGGHFVLAGFSFGGVIAYEMALRLKEQGQELPLLIIMDSDPPSCAEASSRFDLRWTMRNPIRACRSMMGRLGKPLMKWIGSASTTASYGSMSLRDQRYLEAMCAYTAKPYSGKALLIESKSGRTHDPGHDWDVMVRDIEVAPLQCEHLDVLSPPYIGSWVKRLRGILESLEP